MRLGTPFDAKSWVGFNQDTIKRNLGLLALKMRKRRRGFQSIQRIVRTARADAQTVYEKEQDTRHCSIRAEVPWRGTRSVCYAES